jgi:hypothetical protein
MSKVHDRLPLHLGLVIARRRTPLRAVLEAGRAMMRSEAQGEGAAGWEEWAVADEPVEKSTDEAPDYLRSDNLHFSQWRHVALKRNGREMRLRVSTVMGDGRTDDVWYPHLLRRPLAPGSAPDEETDLVHVKNLGIGDTVHILPSTFDFEYLDTTARRFEIAYQVSQASETPQLYRPSRPNRPYLLGEVETLQRIWDVLCTHLRTNQWMQIDGLIEAKRREWNEPRGALGAPSDAFKQLVHDTLGNAEWRRKPTRNQLNLLKDAACTGALNDVIDLYHEAMKERPEEA